MKKQIKTVISATLAASMLFTMTACDKANKECQEVGDEFMQALLDREYEDMADLCKEEEDALYAFSNYTDNEVVDLFLAKATFEVKEADCSTKDGKGTITYIVTLPDYDAAADEDPEDVDELEDIVDDLKDTTEISVKVKFKLNKKDKWEITNPEDIASDLYGELYDVDFGFVNYDALIDHTNWYNRDEDPNIYYDYTSYIDFDVYFTEYLDINTTYEYYYGDDLVKSSTYWAGSYAYYYLYASDMEDAGYDYEIPTGEYTVIVKDSDNNVITTGTCSVVD